MTAVPQLFDQQKEAEKPIANETGPLYEQIGRLQMELTWLKKNWRPTFKPVTNHD